MWWTWSAKAKFWIVNIRLQNSSAQGSVLKAHSGNFIKQNIYSINQKLFSCLFLQVIFGELAFWQQFLVCQFEFILKYKTLEFKTAFFLRVVNLSEKSNWESF